MKKLFSFTIMAIVALMSASTLTSCSSDNDDPVNPKKDEMDTYTYNAEITDDMLSLFDITIISNNNTTSQTLELGESTTFSLHKLFPVAAKTTGKQTFKVKKGTSVTVTANVKLKSNWKEILASLGDKELSIAAGCTYVTPKTASAPAWGVGIKASNLDEDTLEGIIDFLDDQLNME